MNGWCGDEQEMINEDLIQVVRCFLLFEFGNTATMASGGEGQGSKEQKGWHADKLEEANNGGAEKQRVRAATYLS